MNKLLIEGIEAFNKGKYYDAHEFWEDIWTDFHIPDKLFIQGLIQYTVGFFHIQNDNLRGAKNMFKKCRPKIEKFIENDRKIDTESIIISLDNAESQLIKINHAKEFNFKLINKIYLINNY